MVKYSIVFLILIFAFSSAFSQSSLSPVKKNGALKVEGGKIVNRLGVAPQLRGISLSWSLWGGRKYYTPGTVDWLTSDFKVTILRAAMGIQPDSGYLQYPDEQKQLIVNTVNRAIKDGIYVLIDWHDHNANQHVAQSKAFFAEMAQKYKGVPNVIYEIWNEPARVNWDTVKNYAQQVIGVIRKYDADNLIVVGSPNWDQDVDVAAADPVKGYKNIAYSFHFYASDPNHQEHLRAKADKAIKLGLPLFITEWGVGESNGDGEFNADKTATWLKWMEDNHLSWANWNITDKHETTAILQKGAPANGGWTADQLTPAGVYIRDKLRELNK